jgi:hypothetical protein
MQTELMKRKQQKLRERLQKPRTMTIEEFHRLSAVLTSLIERWQQWAASIAMSEIGLQGTTLIG